MKFNALIEKIDDGWFVGQVEEVPAAISQGRTIGELLQNLRDAVHLLLEIKSRIQLSYNPHMK